MIGHFEDILGGLGWQRPFQPLTNAPIWALRTLNRGEGAAVDGSPFDDANQASTRFSQDPGVGGEVDVAPHVSRPVIDHGGQE